MTSRFTQLSIPPFQEAWRHGATHRKVAGLAIPMLLSNLSTPLVALVNNSVAGHLPEADQLAAVAVGGMLYVVLVNVLNFLRMGTTGFSAQALGRGDGDLLRRALWQGALLALCLAALASALLLPGARWLLSMDGAPGPGLQNGALEFFHYRLFGLPAALLGQALLGWLLGAQNARAALAVVLLTNAANAILSLYLVQGCGWGIEGLALAAVCGEWGGLFLALALVGRELTRHPGRLSWRGLRAWHSWLALLAVNRDLFIRGLCLQGVFLLLTLQGAHLGGATVAANALLLNGLELCAYALDGLAHALEALAGRAIGARDRQGLQRALIVTSGWAWLVALSLGLFFWLGGRSFIGLQTNIPAVRQVAAAYLPYLALLPPIAVFSYLLDGLFVAATRAREMRNSMLLAFILTAPLAVLARPLGNQGLWLAFLSFMLLRGLLLGGYAWAITRRREWLLPAPSPGMADQPVK